MAMPIIEGHESCITRCASLQQSSETIKHCMKVVRDIVVLFQKQSEAIEVLPNTHHISDRYQLEQR
jgi:hypothetical protein